MLYRFLLCLNSMSHFKDLKMWTQTLFFLAVLNFSPGILIQYVVKPHQDKNIAKKGDSITLKCYADQDFQCCTFHHGNKKCVQENGRTYQHCDYPIPFMYKSKSQNFYCEIHLKSVKEEDYGNWTCELQYQDSFGASIMGMAFMEIEKPFEIIEAVEPKASQMENDEVSIYCAMNKPYKNCIISHTYFTRGKNAF